jgi:hypothetical protein
MHCLKAAWRCMTRNSAKNHRQPEWGAISGLLAVAANSRLGPGWL